MEDKSFNLSRKDGASITSLPFYIMQRNFVWKCVHAWYISERNINLKKKQFKTIWQLFVSY